jgi:hypothetical protein
MKGLSTLERSVLECLGKKHLTYEEIQYQSGLHENVCFNILQALIIRGVLATDGARYRISENLSPLVQEEINGMDAKLAESLELIEAVLDQPTGRNFKFAKIAMDSRDEKIFLAMLSNLETFLLDAHKKSEINVPLKDRKVIFWGIGEMNTLMHQMIRGK